MEWWMDRNRIRRSLFRRPYTESDTDTESDTNTDSDANADSDSDANTERRVAEQHACSTRYSDRRQHWRCLDSYF